jgi:hypothetical protein
MGSCQWTPSFHVKYFAIFQFEHFCKSVKQTTALCPMTKPIETNNSFVSYDKANETNNSFVSYDKVSETDNSFVSYDKANETNSTALCPMTKPMKQTQQLCVLSRASAATNSFVL